MNVIRHYDKRVEFVAFESAFAVGKSMDKHFGYFRLVEEDRTVPGVIQQSIHDCESFARCQPDVWEGAVDWETTVQTEGHEHSLADDVEMRKAAVVPAHIGVSGGRESIVSRNFVIVCAGRKPGGRAEALPHRLVKTAFGWNAGRSDGWGSE